MSKLTGWKRCSSFSMRNNTLSIRLPRDSGWTSLLSDQEAEKKVREIGAACEPSAEELERSVSAARAALAEGITREAYDVMSQKLYLLSKASDGDGDIDPSDMVETAQEDWEADAGGASSASTRSRGRSMR